MNIQCHEIEKIIIESGHNLESGVLEHTKSCSSCRSFYAAFKTAEILATKDASDRKAMELFADAKNEFERAKRPIWAVPALSFSLSLMALILFFGLSSGKNVKTETAANVDKKLNENQYVMIQTAPVKSEDISVPENLSSYSKLAQILRESK